MTMIDKVSGFLESRLSRRSFVVRSAFAGSALAATGTSFLLEPGTAYAALCSCGNSDCGCDTLCCAGYTEFCCVLNGGHNMCPANTVMGGWWKADGSTFCDGPRYFIDCSATCSCTDGCSSGFGFCDTGCDGLECGCAGGSCDNFLAGCFQFRYGQCNQDLSCVGRIACRVVTCIPPWEIDPTCTMTSATDDNTAEQNAACLETPQPSATVASPVVGMAAAPNGTGYAIVTAAGRVLAFGTTKNVGDMAGKPLNFPIVGMALTRTNKGYWLTASDGGVFAFGDAKFHGSMGGKPLNEPIVGMAPTPGGAGYWQVASDGGIFSFGDAGFHGSTGDIVLNRPVVGMTSTPSGKGYWLVASDGGIFAFGDAKFHGSTGNIVLNEPVVGMATAGETGYWTVASDGGIFAFGKAKFDGSGANNPAINSPVVGMAGAPNDTGYWIVDANGGILAFGGAQFLGSGDKP